MGVVVAAAVVRDGRLLAARRTWPVEHAGRWELPGGRVEEGEEPDAALVREIAEELGCTVSVRSWLPGVQPVAGGKHVLRAAVVDLEAGEPRAHEHDALRWLDAGSLGDVDWLEPDRPFLEALRPLLTGDAGGPAPSRGVLDAEADARAVAEQLARDGWQATVEREAFAGEDDDEDHAWAVVTDAPAAALELLLDPLDGWVDADPDPVVAAPPETPPDLPTAPRRVKRPGGGAAGPADGPGVAGPH